MESLTILETRCHENRRKDVATRKEGKAVDNQREFKDLRQ